MRSVDELVQLFRNKGLRMTPQRRLIFTLLADDTSHPTADELYRRAIEIMPDLSRMTVYSTLAELVSLGELTETETDLDRSVRYDTNVGIHHHLLCVRCRALVDLPDEKVGVSISTTEDLGYQILRQQVTLYGYCPRCQQTPDV